MPANAVNATPTVPDLVPLQKLLNKKQFLQLRQRAGRALKKYPREAALHGFFAAAAAGQRDPRTAEKHYKHAIDLDPQNASYHCDLGNLYFSNERFAPAAISYQHAVSHGMNTPSLAFCLGTCLMQTNRLREAIMQLGNAVAARPMNPDFSARLGEAFEQAGLFDDAIRCHELSLRFSRDPKVATLALARCHYSHGNAQTALDLADGILETSPTDEIFLSLRAAALGALGRVEDSAAAHRKAIMLGNPKGNHFYNYALRQKMDEDPEIVAKLSAAFETLKNPKDQRLLYFAMAKTQQDLGNLEASYDHLLKGNRLQKKELGYDVRVDLARMARLKKDFAEAVPVAPSVSDQDTNPIFVLGMPRSGTTLTEAIIARHPDATACGELNALLQCIVTRVPDQGVPTPEQAEYIRQDYLEKLPAAARKTRYSVDKMPSNFRLIGYILTTMPNARIIHTCRDPRAVAWSNFKTSFSGSGSGFSYDPADMVAYYKAYQDLMAFWHATFPGRIFDLNYEAMTEDPEPHIRGILNHVGLSWHQGCLNPEEGDQSVVTASQTQVRQKIYSGSSQAWRKFEPQAGAWLAKLVS